MAGSASICCVFSPEKRPLRRSAPLCGAVGAIWLRNHLGVHFAAVKLAVCMPEPRRAGARFEPPAFQRPLLLGEIGMAIIGEPILVPKEPTYSALTTAYCLPPAKISEE
jgi:hypothetical protein